MSSERGRWRRGASPDREAFDKLLASLDADRDRAGEAYERLRRKLVHFFEWSGSLYPEELADRTFDRVSRKFTEGDQIRSNNPFLYFYGVARNIVKEQRNEWNREAVALRRFATVEDAADRGDDVELLESEISAWDERLPCLKRCLGRLSDKNRRLIVRYYQGERGTKIGNRKALAGELRVPLNALRIRCHRLRLRLESCVEECLKARGR